MAKKTIMTVRSAARIYSATSRSLGYIPRNSFAARAMRAAYANKK